MYLYGAENNSIENNELEGLIKGIDLFNSFSNNTLLNNDYPAIYQSGILLSGSHDNNITNNDLSRCIQGISVQMSNGNELFENRCYDELSPRLYTS